MAEENSDHRDDAADPTDESPESIEDLFAEAKTDGKDEERPEGKDSNDAADGAEYINEGASDVADGEAERGDGDEVIHDLGGEDSGEAEDSSLEPFTEAGVDVDVSTGDNSGDEAIDAVASNTDDDTDSAAIGAGVDLIGVDDRSNPPKQVGGDKGGRHGRFSTGINEINEQLGGGIPPGRIISLVAPSNIQSELLVKHLAAQHDCLYLSTLRPKWEVEEEVTDYVQKHGDLDSEQRNVRIEQLASDMRLDSAHKHLEQLEGRTLVIIDATNELETEQKDQYIYLLDEVKRKLWETGSVGLFYCIEEEQPPACRDTTLRRADMIWRLQEAVNHDSLRYQIVISKFRGGRALKEPLAVYLTDGIRVETGPFSP